MLFNSTQGNDPRSFFYYNGDYYINGTEIILTDKYIDQNKFNGKKLWKYARYDHQTICNGRVAYFFCRSSCDWLSFNEMGLDVKTKNDYAAYFVIEAINIGSAIEKIIKPIKLERVETEAVMNAIVQPKSDFDNTGLVILWMVYIVAMVGSLIFNQFYILWAIITFAFCKLRKEMLKG